MKRKDGRDPDNWEGACFTRSVKLTRVQNSALEAAGGPASECLREALEDWLARKVADYPDAFQSPADPPSA